MKSSFTSDHHAKTHCFFKIIVSEISSKSKLMIPAKFVKKYGEELQGWVLLKAPGGATWPVAVERKKHEVFLGNGWPEFATFYSLCFGHSVLFEYQGNCNFKVVIFDTSTTEIDYPLQPEKRQRGSGSDEVGACKKKRVRSGCKEACHVGDSLKRKLKRESSAEAPSNMETSSTDEEESGDSEKPSHHANGVQHDTNRMKKPIKLEVDLDSPMQQHVVRAKGVGRRSSSKEESNRALASAKAFKSSNPFFIKVMQPSFVGKTSGFYVRKACLKTYMRKEVEVLFLRVEGKTWLIKCCFQSKRVKLGCGWPQFAEDNALAVGDVCVFELVKPSAKLLEVVIFRAAPACSSSKRRLC